MERQRNDVTRFLPILSLLLAIGCSSEPKIPEVQPPDTEAELCELLVDYQNHASLTSSDPTTAVTDFAYVTVNCTQKQMAYEIQIPDKEDPLPKNVIDGLTGKTLASRCPSLSVQQFGWTITDKYFNANGKLVAEATASPATCGADF